MILIMSFIANCRSTGAKDCTPRMYVKRSTGNLHCGTPWKRVSSGSKIWLWRSRRLLLSMLQIPLDKRFNTIVQASCPTGVRWFFCNATVLVRELLDFLLSFLLLDFLLSFTIQFKSATTVLSHYPPTSSSHSKINGSEKVKMGTERIYYRAFLMVCSVLYWHET